MYNDAGHVPTPSLLLPTPEQEKTMGETAQDLVHAREKLTGAVQQADDGFQKWLKTLPPAADIPGLIAHFSFDELAGTNQFANLIAPTNLSTALHDNTLVPGKSGQAIRFNGDEEISC